VPSKSSTNYPTIRNENVIGHEISQPASISGPGLPGDVTLSLKTERVVWNSAAFALEIEILARVAFFFVLSGARPYRSNSDSYGKNALVNRNLFNDRGWLFETLLCISF
jgi:hypothetical protein